MNIMDFRIFVSLCLLFVIGVAMIVFFVREKPIKKMMNLSFVYLLLITFIIYILVIKNFETILFPIFIIIFINFLLTLITGISIVNNLLVKNRYLKDEDELYDDYDYDYDDDDIEEIEDEENNMETEDMNDEIDETNQYKVLYDDNDEDEEDNEEYEEDGEEEWEKENNSIEEINNSDKEKNIDVEPFKEENDDINDNTGNKEGIIEYNIKNNYPSIENIKLNDKTERDNVAKKIFGDKRNNTDFDFEKAIQGLDIQEDEEDFDNDEKIKENVNKIKERIEAIKNGKRNNKKKEDDDNGSN